VNTVDDKKLVYEIAPRDWVVHNYESSYRGPVSVLEALRQSINTVAVQVAEQTGLNTVQAYGQQLGISTPMSLDLPLALGASGVHPIDLCSAFSAFANGGARYDPYCIESAADVNNTHIFRDDPGARYHASVLNANTVDQINVALREVVLNGTGAAASGVPDAHGKTGTTSSHRDAWFVGYTGSLATAVWMAHVDKHAFRDGRTRIAYLPMPGATGGHVCAPVWASFMKAAAPVQARVDRMRGIARSAVVQPSRDSLITELQAHLTETGMEQDRGAEQAAAEGDPSMTGLTYAQPQITGQPGYGGAAVVSVRQATIPTTSGEADSQDDEGDMRRDMAEGYREFELHKDRYGE